MHIYIIRSFNAIVLQKNSWFSNIFSLGVNFVQNKNGYISRGVGIGEAGEAAASPEIRG